MAEKAGTAERQIRWEEYDDGKTSRRMGKYAVLPDGEASYRGRRRRRDGGREYTARKPVHDGWITCPCDAPAEPGLVLDPFCGTATTGVVALKYGRRFVGIDLYEDHLKIATRRLRAAAKTESESRRA